MILLCQAALALNVAFDIQPRVLRVGEAALGSITIRGVDHPATPTLPPIQGFQVNFSGTERSFSFGTGGRDSATTFRYQFVPIQTGNFVVGPFAYTAQGETANLPAIELQVLAPEAAAPQGGAQPAWSELLFAKLWISPTNLYSQQYFDIYVSVYSRGLNLASDLSLMNMPGAGLSLQPFQELASTREAVRDQIYDVRRFRCKAQALTAGAFKLAPTLRVALIVPRERRRRGGFFDDPFFDSPLDAIFGRAQAQPVDLTPPPVDLVVNPPPAEDQPAGFSGAVGQFSFDVELKPREVSAGDPVTLSLQISGEGNLENVSAPQVVAGDAFKVYEPRLVSKNVDGARATGTKLFEQVLIPRSTQATNLPALAFSYFDPAKAAYETVRRGPFALVVHPSSNVAAKLIQAASAAPEASAALLGTDIVYLKPAPARWLRAGSPLWYQRPLFLALQAVPALATALLFVIVRRRTRLASDVALARRQRAPRSARAAIRKAEAALAKSDRRAFFEAAWDALASYFGDRLNLAPGELGSDAVLHALRRARLAPAELERVRILFERCERERFGIAGDEAVHETHLRGILNELNGVLRQCERLRL